jgi:membrane protease YdiL (CAAX protease family)
MMVALLSSHIAAFNPTFTQLQRTVSPFPFTRSHGHRPSTSPPFTSYHTHTHPVRRWAAAMDHPHSHDSQSHPLNVTAAPQPPSQGFLSRAQRTLFKSSTHYHPALQCLILLASYIFHLTVLTQHSIIFPFQLIPNNKGHFQSLGWDSIAGMASFIAYCCFSNKMMLPNHSSHKQFSPWASIHCDSPSSPFTFPSPPTYTNITHPTFSISLFQASQFSSILALFLLILAYFATGRIASFFELSLYSLAGLGFPITIAMHRSLVVLLGHLAWVLMGSLLLSLLVQPQPFFPRSTSSSLYKWYTQSWSTNFLWWTLGGYFVSGWFFNIADCINQYILPKHVFDLASEGVVAQLINPENNDFFASLVGYMAPCISAPWWEEVLYRGFLLPALCLFSNFWMAVFMSGILFSIHHLSTTGAIPLAVLGWTWATVYAKSGNLLVTILIHACWNSRVFLGSWLGL